MPSVTHQRRNSETELDEGGSLLQFGLGLAGPGEIWVDGLEIDTTR